MNGIGQDWLQIIDSFDDDLVGCTISESLVILTVIVGRGRTRGFQEKNLQKIDSINTRDGSVTLARLVFQRK